MHCWFNICHGIQTMDNSRICHCRCFMSMVSKNFVQPFFRSRGLLRYTHAWTELHKLSWAESLALMMSLFMALTWSELNYCAWFDGTVCEQPALVCRCPQSCSVDPSVWSLFTEHEFALARVQIWTSVRSIWIFGIWPQASKQASRHTHARAQCSHASV